MLVPLGLEIALEKTSQGVPGLVNVEAMQYRHVMHF